MATQKQFSSFQALIASSNVPLFVSFYATWCGHCKLMSPILDDVKVRLGDRIKVVKINTEKYPNLASQYEVKALPTSILFIEGEPASRIKGVMQTPQLIQYLQKFL